MAQIRIGECKRCGECCFNCHCLSITNTCLIYNNRPDWCIKEFPRNKYDLEIRGLVDKCGYKFIEVK